MGCYEMNTTSKFVNSAPTTHSCCYLLFRQDFTDVLYLTHAMEVNITQPINYHLKLLSVQFINDLPYYLILSHQHKNVVKRYLWFLELWVWEVMLQSHLFYQLLYYFILLRTSWLFLFIRCRKTHDLIEYPFVQRETIQSFLVL